MYKLETSVKISLCILLVGFIILLIPTKSKTELNIDAFNSDKTLVCFSTLIITNSNWKLSNDNLINNNSAGYISIKDCEVKHD